MTTTTTPTSGRPVVPHVGVPGLRLVRSEIRKITTTNAWWLFGIASVVITGLFMAANMAEAADRLARARDTTDSLRLPPDVSPADQARAQAQFAESHDVHLQTI